MSRQMGRVQQNVVILAIQCQDNTQCGRSKTMWVKELQNGERIGKCFANKHMRFCFERTMRRASAK